jgi:hypothetical protein
LALRGGFERSVAFIVGERKNHEGALRHLPIGTGFFIGFRTPPEPQSSRAFTLYLTTAAHVVRSELDTCVRLRRLDGSLHDLPIPINDWMIHGIADVAITPLELEEEHSPFDISVMPAPDFFPSGARSRHRLRQTFNRPMLGDTVYFLGLFSPIPLMGERNVPLVRSGTLAGLNQEHVPVGLPDGTVLEHTAHLIDCRSYAGFSGSPCLVQFPRDPDIGGVGRIDEETEILGLVSGHFDEHTEANLTGELADMGTVGVPINLGVGIVTPAEAIEELLAREDVVEDRRAREAAYVAQHNVATDPPDLLQRDSPD